METRRERILKKLAATNTSPYALAAGNDYTKQLPGESQIPTTTGIGVNNVPRSSIPFRTNGYNAGSMPPMSGKDVALNPQTSITPVQTEQAFAVQKPLNLGRAMQAFVQK